MSGNPFCFICEEEKIYLNELFYIMNPEIKRKYYKGILNLFISFMIGSVIGIFVKYYIKHQQIPNSSFIINWISFIVGGFVFLLVLKILNKIQDSINKE